jgi:hypothetical protein
MQMGVLQLHGTIVIVEYFVHLDWNNGWKKGGLNLPAGKALPYATTINIFSHYFVADEAFSLKLYLICPYPKTTLNTRKEFTITELVGAKK